MDEHIQPILVQQHSLPVCFLRADAEDDHAAWHHPMPALPPVGATVRFRCRLADCPDGHDTEEAQLLMTLPWRVVRIEIELGCEEGESECCEDDECACHEDEEEPPTVSTVRYVCIVEAV